MTYEIKNDRDLFLSTQSPRLLASGLPDNIIIDGLKRVDVDLSSMYFKVDELGNVQGEDTISILAILQAITGTPVFTVVSGTATLGTTLDPNERTLTFSDMSSDIVQIMIEVEDTSTFKEVPTDPNITYSRLVTLSKVFDGVDGDSQSVDIVFKRNPTQPTTPDPSTSTPSGWYTSVGDVPYSTDPLWSSVGTKAAGSTLFVWQTPIFVEGNSVVELSIYRRSTSTPVTPSGGSFNFSTLTLTPPVGWSSGVPVGNDPIYISRGVASVSGSSGTDSSILWTSPVKFVENGADGLTANITADTFSWVRDVDGGSWTPSGTSVTGSVFFKRGSTTVASRAFTVYRDASGNLTCTSNTVSDISISVSGNATKSLTVTAEYVLTGTTVSATFTAVLSGNTGEHGPRNATGYLYYQLAGTSAPANPSASSYNFTTGTFSTITPNWSPEPPTYSADNSNNYYYVYYNVQETSFGGSQGITISSVKQGISFNGLVTFTSSTSVSDGSDTLSFGSGGTTQIDGGSIITDTITADKINVTDLSAINATLGNVTAGNITGSRFSTSTSTTGQRFVIDDSNHVAEFYDSSNQLVFHGGSSFVQGGSVWLKSVSLARGDYAGGVGFTGIGGQYSATKTAGVVGAYGGTPTTWVNIGTYGYGVVGHTNGSSDNIGLMGMAPGNGVAIYAYTDSSNGKCLVLGGPNGEVELTPSSSLASLTLENGVYSSVVGLVQTSGTSSFPVGSLLFAAHSSTTASYSYGDNIAGSGLRSSNVFGDTVSESFPGTWKCLGRTEADINVQKRTTMWIRVA